MHDPAPSRWTATHSLGFSMLMDLVLCAAKFGAFLVTGSAAMLSEGLHSLADLANQLLLAVGVRRSMRPPSPTHPYGHGAARPFWALMSASGVLFVGAGATVWNGLGRLVDPEPLVHLPLALAILALGVLTEAASFTAAIRTLWREADTNDTSRNAALLRSGDPVLVAIVAGDAAGLVGVVTAAVGIGLSYVLGNPVFDAAAAIVVGLVMGASALFLIDRNRQILVGSAVTEEHRRAGLAALHASPLVRGVRDVKATSIDETTVRFKAEVDFDGAAVADEWLAANDPAAVIELEDAAQVRAFLQGFSEHVVRRLGHEVDRIEEQIKADHPDVRHIDLEVDG